MNHVAHCALSYPEPEILIGNFIADYVKGSAWTQFSPGIQKGILLHRRIDAFTDNHPAVRDSVRRIRPVAGRFAGAVTDILYDHLLYLHWVEVLEHGFEPFAAWAYEHLALGADAMPDVLRARLPRMLEGRFLHGYTHAAGLQWVLERFSGRLGASAYDAAQLWMHFDAEKTAYSADFKAFFPDLQADIRLATLV